ncbi:condensation domain-containing protein [Streptomyces sp. NPDC090306]|uniref:condensation domain-containing protein n=1 Tax=Streptomyces sp. NPDC090306 TaxID=3365961 RepID=UPI0038220A9E
MARLTGEFADWNNLVFCAVWLTGELDVAAVRDAWRVVCLRHDVMRRAYRSPDEAYTYEDVLGELDFRTAETDAEALEMMRRILGTPFGLDALGFSRIAIVQRDERRHLLGIVVDHIINDQVSWGRLMRDFGELYERVRAHDTSAGDIAGRGTYQGFASLQRREFSTAWGEERRSFWLSHTEQFGNYPPAFPVAGELKSEPSLKIVNHALPTEASSRVLELARRARATPFVVAVSGVLAGMQEVSGAQTVGVTTNHHGRVLPGTSETVGQFVQTVPLHLSSRPRGPLETVREVFSRSLDVFEYSLPLRVAGKYWNEDLASVSRDAGVYVTLNETAPSLEEAPLVGTKAEYVELDVPGGKSWPATLLLDWQLNGTAPQLVASYNENFFQDTAIESLLQAAERFVLSVDS